MAAHLVLTVGEGVIQIPPDAAKNPHLQPGTRLQLVSASASVLVFAVENSPSQDDSWRSLEGLLAGAGPGATEIKQREREWEFAHDERKFGIAHPAWPASHP